MKVIKLVIFVVKYFIKFKTLKAPNSRHKIKFLNFTPNINGHIRT